MADFQGVLFEPRYGLAVCTVHGTAIHPDEEALKKHLRGRGHFCKGRALKEAVGAILRLELKPLDELLADPQPAVWEQPVARVRHLAVEDGWSCGRCDGELLTTSRELAERHVGKAHGIKGAGRKDALLQKCLLQTFFPKTGERRYFRVSSTPQAAEAEAEEQRRSQSQGADSMYDKDGGCGERERAFVEAIERRQEEKRAQRTAAAAKGIAPEPRADGRGREIWMARLGIDKYIAGLRKDEIWSSYAAVKAEGGKQQGRASSKRGGQEDESEDEDEEECLSQMQVASASLLNETWRWCQQGPEQRMTDPQAARISSFWRAANPDAKAKSFRRGIARETLDRYTAHWTQLLTFCWRGWRGELFPSSISTSISASIDTASVSSRRHDSEQSGDSDSSSERGSDDSGRSGDDCCDHGAQGNAQRPKRYLYYSPEVRRCLQGVSTAAVSGGGGDGKKRAAAMAEAVAELSKCLLTQHLPRSPFQSPILSFATMLSVNQKTGGWDEPGSFNSHLSALVYCAQLWVFRFACAAVDARRLVSNLQQSDGDNSGDVVVNNDGDDDDGLDEELDCWMREYFTNEVSKPMGYVLLWRRRLFGIAPLTMANRPAWWNLDNTRVTYRGVSITIDQVRQLCRRTIDRARGLLYGSLMLGATHVAKAMPQHLEENDYNREMGWWFALHPENKVQLAGRESALIEHIAETADLRELYLALEMDPKCQRERLIWRSNSVRFYKQLAQDFLKDMAVAVHFSAGPPVRAPEFMSPMWRNTEQQRHIQLRYGQVMVHLVEHKMMGTTGRSVSNVRFLCDELSELLVNYLLYVVPVLEAMAWQDDVGHEASPFLWSDGDGERWNARQLGNIMLAACRRAEVPEVGISIWRQMSSAIINTHFDSADRESLIAAQGEEATRGGDDGEGEGPDVEALVSMSNHSLRTHQIAYANSSPFANVWDSKLKRSYKASRAWARFLGLGREEAPQQQGEIDAVRKRRHTGSMREQAVARKVLSVGLHRKRQFWSSTALLDEARRLYRDEKLRWRCREQEQAMRLVADGAPEVLLVMATGAGKSLTFMLGSSLPGARTTIVVVPLVLLRVDLIRRCVDMGLQPAVWSSAEDVLAGLDGTSSLLFVSVEVASKPAFCQYVRQLSDTGNLDRIIVDECHLIHTSAHYRRSMTQLSRLRQYPVPFVFLTATLPPRLEKVLFQGHHIGSSVRIVRGSTKRSNLRYGVEHLQPVKNESFVKCACKAIQERWEENHRDWTGARVMVFVRSRSEAEEAAEHMGCTFYHRDAGSLEEKEMRLKDWISGQSGSLFLACTTAAGAGVDYAHVRWVVHVGEPYGLIDYAQESGRAGRDGLAAGATIFLRGKPMGEPVPTPIDHPDPADDWAMKQYLRGQECRRLCMARELDAETEWKRCEGEDVACDVCQAGDSEEMDEMLQAEQEAERSREEARERGCSEEEAGFIRQQRSQMEAQFEMDEYLSGLTQVQDSCVLCRVLMPGRDWRHRMDACSVSYKQAYLQSKSVAMAAARAKGKRGFMADFAACYQCGQPQSVCSKGWLGAKGSRTQSGRARADCEYTDLAMPLVWAAWEAGGEERRWVQTALEVQASSAAEALIAAGKASTLGGERCVLAVKILAERLKRWRG